MRLKKKNLLSHCGEFTDRREEMDAMSFVCDRQQRAAVKSKDVSGPSDICTFNPNHRIHSSWLSSCCDSRLQKKTKNKCVSRLIVGPLFCFSSNDCESSAVCASIRVSLHDFIRNFSLSFLPLPRSVISRASS